MSYSEKLTAHYLALAESPVSSESFAGADVRFSNEFEGLESEMAKVQSMHDSGQVDWVRVLEKSEALLRSQSKDLRVAVWLTWALYQRESFPGLVAGLTLLHALCRHRWSEIHPAKGRTRAASIGWLVPRLEQGLGDDVAINERLPLFRQLLKQLEGLDAICTAHLRDEAPLLLPLCRRLKSMVQRIADNQPQAGTVAAAVAQVKQATAQLFNPDAPIENEKEAHKALCAQRENARLLCAWWLKHKATDIRALRLNRSLLWLSFDVLPERNAEQITQLRGLPADKIKSYQDLFRQGNHADLLVQVEASVTKAPLWLDGQRLAWECLQALNAELAMHELEAHLALFIKRLPDIVDLRWHDGSPFADDATRAWIAAQVIPHLQPASIAPRAASIDQLAPWELALEEASRALREEGLKPAVQLLTHAMRNARGAREHFLWQLATARLCFCAKKYELAKVQLEALDQILQRSDLDAWEPDLMLQVLHLLHSCCELLPQNHAVRERKEETYRRLCHLDLERVIE